jgi:hypothetical protein
MLKLLDLMMLLYIPAQTLNQHDAAISLDTKYAKPSPKHTVTASTSVTEEWHIFQDAR